MDHLPSTLDWSRVQSFLAVAETGSHRGHASGSFFHLIAESLQNP